MKILQLTAHFRPNIGGVETHLDDLCKALAEKGFKVTVLTYRPLQTKTGWKIIEREKNIEIIRLPWISNLFYKLVKSPFLEFLYLLPGLFFWSPFVILLKKIDVIHSHGLVAGFVGVFWGKIFNKRTVVSIHSIYHFPKKGLYRDFVGWIFKNADYCLGLSKQSAEEIRSLGIPAKKVDNFTYWIDLHKFKVQNSKLKIKKQLGWEYKFTVLFVGRLVEGKGVEELLESVRKWHRAIDLKIIGAGPLEDMVKKAAEKNKNLEFIGTIDQNRLPLYYSVADLLIVPSTSEEGFGRVILESLACGTPILGAKKGAIPEAMNETVGRFLEVSPLNIKNKVEYFFNNKNILKKLSQNARKFAERRYSENNAEKIINTYKAG
ncbi:glycosyltransferase family 4 protein [Candidatus Daviesbacteria bacterium]|nr:glycosyltransferase family 4 protein [Candidatus Daviesbacteria bacterium]